MLRQKDVIFYASLSYTPRLHLKKKGGGRTEGKVENEFAVKFLFRVLQFSTHREGTSAFYEGRCPG